MAYLKAVGVEVVAGPYQGRVAGMAGGEGRVLLSLPKADRILSLELATGQVKEERRYTGKATAIAFAADGRLYGCQPGARRIVCFEADGSMTLPAEQLEGKLHNHPLDLTCGADGRIWFSDVRWEGRDSVLFPQLGFSSVLVLEKAASGRWQLRRASVDGWPPGALQLSADGTTLYVAGNPWDAGAKGEIRAYPVSEHGTLGEPAPWVALEPDSPPDPRVTAMSLSRDGLLLVALSSGTGKHGALMAIEPGGSPRHLTRLAWGPTSLSFAGPGLERLFVGGEDGKVREVRDLGLVGWGVPRRGVNKVDGGPTADLGVGPH